MVHSRFQSGAFTARPGPDLHSAMTEAAAAAGVSLSAWANDLFSRATGGLPTVPRTLGDMVSLRSLSEDDAVRVATWPYLLLIYGRAWSGKTALLRAVCRERADNSQIAGIVAAGSDELAEVLGAIPRGLIGATFTSKNGADVYGATQALVPLIEGSCDYLVVPQVHEAMTTLASVVATTATDTPVVTTVGVPSLPEALARLGVDAQRYHMERILAVSCTCDPATLHVTYRIEPRQKA